MCKMCEFNYAKKIRKLKGDHQQPYSRLYFLLEISLKHIHKT